MTALVTCGHSRAGLAAVRCLGRAQHAVAVGAPMRPALASWSRYATSTLVLPNPETAARSFVDSVVEQSQGRGTKVIFCGTDSALWALSRWRDELPEETRRILPPHDAVVRSLDRQTLHDLASSVGIECVPLLRVDARQGIEPALRDAKRLGMPATVLPLVPWVEREDGSRRMMASERVETIAELRRLLYEREDLIDAGCLIEPHPTGQTFGYGSVWVNGEPVVEVFQQHFRERDAYSGVSTCAETIEPDLEIRRAGRRLLEALQWNGPAFVEFLRTEKGELRLKLILARLWSSVHLAISAGVDVPMLLFRSAMGQSFSKGLEVAKPGVRFRWVVGDAQAMLQLAKGQRLGSMRKRLRVIMDVLDPRDLMHLATDVMDKDDPMPFVFELQHMVQVFRHG
ncbi:MAG: hypothetical protein GY822_07970 [Deltaproteobacteria bacterium]|nr:hypothetical protein [Deltaproteobacteria bacterium]